MIGFVFFVASLQAGNYKFQFTNFAWTHMALYLIVVQAHFVMNNIFEGMIWFFLPAALVITNDIFAYICGIMFGRTQLIKLSPKKTVEGFVGAWIATVLFSFLLVNILMRSKYFICPVNVSQPDAILYIVTDTVLNIVQPAGSRRQCLHWTQMRCQSRLLASHLRAPTILFPTTKHQLFPDVCADAAACSGPSHFCISYCSLWRLLRLRP